jgi:hypothetical protein
MNKTKKLGKGSTPAKWRGNGVKLLNGGVDPAVGKATQIQPGEVRNAGGRPKRKPVLEAMESAILANPSIMNKIAKTALKEAARSLGWFTCVRDMLDGKPEEDEGSGITTDIDLNLNVNFVDEQPKELSK